jgi:hypothetical protein
MTTYSVASAVADARSRVHAVRYLYARRGERATVRGRAYIAYLVALFALLYLAPVVYAASTSPPLVSVGAPARAAVVAGWIAVTACWGAQLAGRYWGPLVVQPFLLHVFTSTDLPPTSYLGSIARRRLTYAGTGTLLSACTAAYLTTDLFDHLGTALPGLAVALGVSAVAAVAWLWGQVQSLRHNFALAAAAGVWGLTVTVVSRWGAVGGGLFWLLAGVSAVAAVLLGRAAFLSIRTVDLARLARESARADQAGTYAMTGTFHHALDLYRPEPRGFTTALIGPDGRLRGYVAQGVVRALRTPGRAVAAVTALLAGGAVLTLGAHGPGGRLSLTLWIAGAVCVYLGSGWVSETWRGLRDELTSPPLFGEWWGGTLARALAWPVTAVAALSGLAGSLAFAVQWPLRTGPFAETVLVVSGTLVLVLAARFMREMKLELPLELLLPIITPLGDLSGLRIVAWQFDGVVAVVLGIAFMHAVPSALGATLLAIGVAACCVWTGLRRTGWAHLGLLARLRRA